MHRFAIVVALATVACGTSEAPPSDGALGDSSAADGASMDGAVEVGADTSTDGSPPDAGPADSRAMDTGAMDTGADAMDSGPVDGAWLFIDDVVAGEPETPRAIAVNDDAVYAVGEVGAGGRLERRARSDGSIVYRLDIAMTPAGAPTEVALAGDSVYLVNRAGALERRLAADGSLVGSFGTGGQVEITGLDVQEMLTDGTWLYVAGTVSGSAQWAVEKRSVGDGALAPTFGIAGVVSSTVGPRFVAMTLAGAELLVAGREGVGDGPMPIERRRTADGTPVTSWGAAGTLSWDLQTSIGATLDLRRVLGGVLRVVGADLHAALIIEVDRGRRLLLSRLDAGDGTEAWSVVYDPASRTAGLGGAEGISDLTVEGLRVYYGGFEQRITSSSVVSRGSIFRRFAADGTLIADLSGGGSSVNDITSFAGELYLLSDSNEDWRIERRMP